MLSTADAGNDVFRSIALALGRPAVLVDSQSLDSASPVGAYIKARHPVHRTDTAFEIQRNRRLREALTSRT